MTANPLSSIPPIGPPSGQPQGPGGNRFRPIDPLRLLRQHAILLAVAGVVGLALGVGTYFLLRYAAPEFESTATMEVTVARPTAYEGPAEQRAREEQLSLAINDQIAAIKGENTLGTVLEMPSVRDTQWFRSFNGNLIAAQEALAERVLKANRLRDTSFIELAATTRYEDDARPIAQAAVDAYLAQRQVQSNRDWSDLRDVWQRQLRETTDRITRLQNTMDDFKRRTGISPETRAKHPVVTEAERIAEELGSLRFEANFLESTVNNLEQTIRSENFEPGADEVREIEMTPAVAERDQRMRRIEEMLLAARGRFPENHRQIRELEAQLNAVREAREETFREETRKYLQSRLSAASKRLSSSREVIAQKQQQLQELEQSKLDLSQQISDYTAMQQEIGRASCRERV
jgi:polysaccharide biosynthesis transport protein